jgi:hypothetical protein
MRVWRAQHMTERHPRQYHVVDIAAAAAQQPWILEPRHRLPQREFTHAFASDRPAGNLSTERIDDRNPFYLSPMTQIL